MLLSCIFPTHRMIPLCRLESLRTDDFGSHRNAEVVCDCPLAKGEDVPNEGRHLVEL